MKSFILLIRHYQNYVLLTLSGFIVPLITNLFSSWLAATFGKTPAQLFQLIAILFTLILTLWVMILIFRSTSVKQVLIPRELQAKPHAGLICLVGPGRTDIPFQPKQSPAAEAIRYHLQHGQLKHVWLVTSDAGIPVAEALRTEYGGQVAVNIRVIHNFVDINDTYLVVQKIYAEEAPRLKLNPQKIMADYTGGTSSMTVGMALAAANGRFHMEFTSGKQGANSVPIQTALAISQEENLLEV